jgi:topoisomerase IA-like protein
MGNYHNNTHASIDPRNYGFSKLSTLARAQDYLEVRQADGQAPRVRLKPKPAKTAAKTATRSTTAKTTTAKATTRRARTSTRKTPTETS